MNALVCASDSDQKEIINEKKTTQQARPSTAGRKSDKQLSGEAQQCNSSSVLKNANNDDCCICSDTFFEPKETEGREKVKNNAEFDLKEVANNTGQEKLNGKHKNLNKNEEEFDSCETNENSLKEERLIKKRKTSSASLCDTSKAKPECQNTRVENVLVEDIDEVEDKVDEDVDQLNMFTESNNFIKKKTSENIVLFVDDSEDDDNDCIVIGAKTTKSSSGRKKLIETKRNSETKQNSSTPSSNDKNKLVNNFNTSKSNTKNESNECNNDFNTSNSNTNNVVKTDKRDYDEISKEKLLESLRSNINIRTILAELFPSNDNKPIQGCATPKKCSSAGSFSSETCTPSTSVSESFSPNVFLEISPQSSLEKIIQQSYIENNVDIFHEKDLQNVMKSCMSQKPVYDGFGNSNMNEISKGESSSDLSLNNSSSFSSGIWGVNTSFSTLATDNISTNKLAISAEVVGTSPSVLRTVDISAAFDASSLTPTVCKLEQTTTENVNVNNKEETTITEEMSYNEESILGAIEDSVVKENEFITSIIPSGPSKFSKYTGLSMPLILYGLKGMNLYNEKNASPGFNEAMNLLDIIARIKLCDLTSIWTPAELSKFQAFVRRLQA